MIQAALARVPLFASLSSAEIEHLAQTLRFVELPAGAILFQENEPGDSFFILLTGTVEVVKALDTAQERRLDLRRSGEFLGEMSMFDPHGERTATVRALTDVQLVQMNHTDLKTLLHRQPDLAFELIRELSLRLSTSQNAAIAELSEKNRELAQAYLELQAAQVQVIEKERMERELQVARKIQESMLPLQLPQLPGFDFGARMLPARAVGGDLFDFIPLTSDSLGIVIGDVSDKGVPAALFMAQSRSLLRAEARRSRSPARVLTKVNNYLLEMNAAGMFITVLYGVLDRATRNFTYARAGHELPLLFDAGGKSLPVGFCSGQLLGVLPDPILDEQAVHLPPGSKLLLNTDGATDATDMQGTRLGAERLLAVIQANLDGSAQELCDRVIAEINRYQDCCPQADDITLVAIASTE